MIDTIAISSGTSPATTVPKTSRRMISAAGRPNFSSPFWRSLSESLLESWSRVSLPVIPTSKSGSASACTTAAMTSGARSSLWMKIGISVAWRSAETSDGSLVP